MAKTVKELSLVVNELQTRFQSELSGFKESLKMVASPELSATSGFSIQDLSKKFMEFENDIMKQVSDLKNVIDVIQQKMDVTDIAIDRNEQQLNNLKLVIHGVLEKDGENLIEEIISLVQNRLNIPVDKNNISHCGRIGKKRVDKSRPIVITFSVKWLRDKIYVNKAKLKGSKLVCTEFLTKKRLTIFKKCREVYGRQCWTSGGLIVVLVNGRKNFISTAAEMDSLRSGEAEPAADGGN